MQSHVERLRWLALTVSALWLVACGTIPLTPPAERYASAEDTVCLALLTAMDAHVAREQVGDAQAARVAGFPHLRANRFLASFRHEISTSEELAAWLEQMRQLDAAGRRVELANLSDAARASLAERAPASSPATRLIDRIINCTRRLATSDRQRQDALAQLQRALIPPDHYRTWMRTAGLYPFTALPAAIGARKLYAELQMLFDTPLEQLPILGELVTYTPAAQVDVTAVTKALQLAPRDALGIPLIETALRERLAAAYAPIWIIDVADDYDHPGWPAWDSADKPMVAGSPVAFYQLEYTRFQGSVLLQISYTIWFDERPRAGRFDLLGGRLDGLVWRVTLGSDGEPLIFDSIHPCGCYHHFFPTHRLQPLPRRDDLEEWAFAPQPAPPSDTGMALRIASGTHYLQRLLTTPGSSIKTTAYQLVNYDELRSLRHRHGRRSLFRPDGIVAGTERLERWLLWPLGISEPGAMRQSGTQATAFLGHRHFDDPYWIADAFRPTPPTGGLQ